MTSVFVQDVVNRMDCGSLSQIDSLVGLNETNVTQIPFLAQKYLKNWTGVSLPEYALITISKEYMGIHHVVNI